MTDTHERKSKRFEKKGLEKDDSEESVIVSKRHRRSGINYQSWVTDCNSEGKSSLDIIVDWLKIKENYISVMEDLAFDNKFAAMPSYEELVNKLVETEHVTRKPEAVRQHCIELQNKFYSILDEFDGRGYAFRETEDNAVKVFDKNNKMKRLSVLVKSKCKYFYDLRPVNIEWEVACPKASNYYLEKRKMKSDNHILSLHSSKGGSSNKRLREDADDDDRKSVDTQKESAAAKLPRVIAETNDDDDDDDDDELSSVQSSQGGSPKWIHNSKYGQKNDLLNGSFNSENTQSSSSNTSSSSSTVLDNVELTDGEDDEIKRHTQQNKGTTQPEETIVPRQVHSQKGSTAIEKHKQSNNRSTESIRQNVQSEVQRRHKVSNTEQNTSNDDSQRKRRKKKQGDDLVKIAKGKLKLANRRIALEERKVAVAERGMALEEKKLALKERLIEDQRVKKRFSLLDWFF